MARTPGPPTWATKEQTEFLQSYFPDYQAISNSNRHYTDFWAELNEAWFGKYPAHQDLHPDQSLKELTVEEREVVTKAMDKTISVCSQFLVFLYTHDLTGDLSASQKLVSLESQFKCSYVR